MKNLRHYSRLPFQSSSTLHLPGQEKTYSTILLDISLKGALVEEPGDWPGQKNGPCLLKIMVDEQLVQIQMETEIVHSEDGHLGLHCRSIDLDSITHLRRLLELNLGDPNLVERELFFSDPTQG